MGFWGDRFIEPNELAVYQGPITNQLELMKRESLVFSFFLSFLKQQRNE